jgi:hypothetical protein
MTMYCVDSRHVMLSIEDDKITFIKPHRHEYYLDSRILNCFKKFPVINEVLKNNNF